jgi:hypothetical protein
MDYISASWGTIRRTLNITDPDYSKLMGTQVEAGRANTKGLMQAYGYGKLVIYSEQHAV